MRVIEVISDCNIGGAGRLLLNRLSHTDYTKFDTAVALPRDSRLIPLLQERAIPMHALHRCADRSWELSAVGELCRLFRTERPDLVHAHGCLSARLAATLCSVPVRVHTRHCCYPISPLWRVPPLRALGGALQGALSDGVIAVAEAAADDLRRMGVREERIRVIINGVDALPAPNATRREAARAKWGIPADAFVAGMVARLERCKGHEDLLRAARILCRRDPRYYVLLAGDGSREGELRQMAEALDIADHVRFTGFLEDVREAFACLDVNVNCSCGTETSSLSLSEGMSMGLPCVASDYGGNPYMVCHGENGYVYPVGDFVQLARLLYVLSEDKALYRRMSDGAQRRYERELTAERMTRLTEQYYEELYAQTTE